MARTPCNSVHVNTAQWSTESGSACYIMLLASYLLKPHHHNCLLMSDDSHWKVIHKCCWIRCQIIYCIEWRTQKSAGKILFSNLRSHNYVPTTYSYLTQDNSAMSKMMINSLQPSHHCGPRSASRFDCCGRSTEIVPRGLTIDMPHCVLPLLYREVYYIYIYIFHILLQVKYALVYRDNSVVMPLCNSVHVNTAHAVVHRMWQCLLYHAAN